MDKIIRCITKDGSIMASAIDSSDIVNTAQIIHKTTPVATAALGRLLTASSLMGTMLKQKNASITLNIKAGGPLGAVVAVSDSKGNCRGYVDNTNCETTYYDNGKLNVAEAVGKNGVLNVLRDYGSGSPYIGQVEIISGEIAEDITNYYATSEQIPTVCALGVLLDKENGDVLLAGGLLIQLLPGADEKIAAKLEENASKLEPVTTMLAKGISIEDMCKKALDGFEMEILDEYPIDYVCTCSKDRVLRSLSTLTNDDLKTLPDEDGNTEVNCNFCNKNYNITTEDIEMIISQRENTAE